MTTSSEKGRGGLDERRLRWAIRTVLSTAGTGTRYVGRSDGMTPDVLSARKAALRRYADNPTEPFHHIAKWLLDGVKSDEVDSGQWSYVQTLAREEAKYIEGPDWTLENIQRCRPDLELFARLGGWPDYIPDLVRDSHYRDFVTDPQFPDEAVQEFFGHRRMKPSVFVWVWAWVKRVERAGGELVVPQWAYNSNPASPTVWRALVLAIVQGLVKVPVDKRVATLASLERWAGDTFDSDANTLMQGVGIDLEQVSDAELAELTPICWSAALKLAERQGRRREPLSVPPVSKRVVEPKWKLDSTWCKSYFRTLFTGNFEQDQAIFEGHRGDGVYCRAFFEIHGSTRRVVNEADLFGPVPLLYLHNVVFPKGPPPEPTYAACFAHSQRSFDSAQDKSLDSARGEPDDATPAK